MHAPVSTSISVKPSSKFRVFLGLLSTKSPFLFFFISGMFGGAGFAEVRFRRSLLVCLRLFPAARFAFTAVCSDPVRGCGEQAAVRGFRALPGLWFPQHSSPWSCSFTEVYWLILSFCSLMIQGGQWGKLARWCTHGKISFLHFVCYVVLQFQWRTPSRGCRQLWVCLLWCSVGHSVFWELLSCSLTSDIASMWNKVLTTSDHYLVFHLCLEMRGEVQHLATVRTLKKIQTTWNTWTISLENWVRFCVTILRPL